MAHELYVSQEQEKSQSFNAYDHLPYAVIVSDASGIILGLNKYAEMYLKIENLSSCIKLINIYLIHFR